MGRYCFGHDGPPYLEGLRLGCFKTRAEARKAARALVGGDEIEIVRVALTISRVAGPA